MKKNKSCVDKVVLLSVALYIISNDPKVSKVKLEKLLLNKKFLLNLLKDDGDSGQRKP